MIRSKRSCLAHLFPLLGIAPALFVTNDAVAGEPFAPRVEKLLTPGRSAVTDDTAEAMALNPANISNLKGPELRWTYFRCAEASRASCGHAVDAATSLPFNFATGLRLDFVQPEGSLIADYNFVTWDLAYKLSERLQFGTSFSWVSSDNTALDSVFRVNTGLSYRPNTRLAFALVGNDLNAPRQNNFLIPYLADRNYLAGFTLRPTGTRAIEVGIEGRYFEGSEELRPRATLGLEIPGVGRARGDVEFAHIENDSRRGVAASASLEIGIGKATVGGGAAFGNAFGTRNSAVGFGSVSIADFYSGEHIGEHERAVSIRMESTPGPRTHVRNLRALWKIAEDPKIAAVTLIMRAEPVASYAHAEEMADALRVIRSHGKKVLCSWEDAGPKALYVCANADRIVLNPAGGLRYSGIKTTHMYLAGLLKKIGVKAEFVRIGAHKSAPEQYMNEHASDVAKSDQLDLLAQYEGVFTENLVRYRHMTADAVRQNTARGPFVATEAKEAGFVDGFAFDDEIERVTQEVVGRKVSLEKYEEPKKAADVIGVRKKVGLLYIDGDIIDGRSSVVPLLGTRLIGSYTIAESAKRLREDNSVKAVVLRVESPGGSSMASDVMWRELKLLADAKPLIVSMGSVAASGGYYVAMASKQIYALPLTITGSIGIFYGKADVSELLGKLGVNIEVRKTTPRADAESFYRGFTEDERKELDHKVAQFYDVFLTRVSEGRGKPKDAIDKMAQGRVWSGQQAFERGLVDHLGGLRHALEAARKAADLPADAPILETPSVAKTVLDQALELAGLRVTSPLSLMQFPAELRDTVRAIAPLAVFPADMALARMEWMPLEAMGGIDPETDVTDEP